MSKKSKEKFLFTPSHATEALKSIGEDYDRKKATLYYRAVLLVALVFGLMFELNIIFLLIVALVYVLCVPQLLYNQKKCAYETKRFNDINSYMSQMAQSFIYTNDVIKSLEETKTCFTSGPMSDTLYCVFGMIEEGKGNIKQAEQEALSYIEFKYDCEKLRNLHAFFLNAEELGGECQKEFRILESMRTAWQSVAESIQRKKIWERNIGVVVYAFFLFICIIMLHIMRDANLDIVNLFATQVIDMFLLIGFILYFVFMDNRLNKTLLLDAVVMSEEKANAYFNYLENYDAKVEKRKYRAFVFLSIIVSAVLLCIKPGLITLGIGIILIFISLHVHSFMYLDAQRIIREEIGKAFPKWLFDVMLLLQRESVEGAIEKSIETAPPVLKRELYRFIMKLSQKPHDADAYMSFLRDFHIQYINEIMRKLYSLAVGANRDSEVLEVVMEKNIKSLERAERDSMLLKDSFKTFTWVPFICVGLGCAGYMVIAIVISISGIIDMIG